MDGPHECLVIIVEQMKRRILDVVTLFRKHAIKFSNEGELLFL